MKKKTIIARTNAGFDSFTVTHEGKDYKYKIQQPSFEQLSAALSVSVGFGRKLDMAGAGKSIWELCCIEFDEYIEENARLLIAVCVELFNEYVAPVDAEIKKN
jgi:hypothetical protein